MARAFSNDMLVRRFFDHTTPTGSLLMNVSWTITAMGCTSWGEYLVFLRLQLRQPGAAAKMIVADWMSTPVIGRTCSAPSIPFRGGNLRPLPDHSGHPGICGEV